MNKVVNDYGETVYAIGQDFSDARARVLFPKLIRRVDSYYYTSGNAGYIDATDLVKREQPEWFNQIMRCSLYNPENRTAQLES